VDCSSSDSNITLYALISILVGVVMTAIGVYCCWDTVGEGQEEELAGSLHDGEVHNLGAIQAAVMSILEAVGTGEDGNFQRWQNKLLGLLKIVISFGQIVGTFNVTFDVPWPASLTSVFDFLNIMNLDFLQAINLTCYSKNYTFYHTFLFTITYPLVMVALCWLIKAIRAHFAAEEEQMMAISVQHWKFTLFGAFLIYPSVSSTVLKLYSFNPHLPDKYLMVDYRLTMDSEWEWHAYLGALAVLVYPIGIPLLFMWALMSYKDLIHDDSKGDDQEAAMGKAGFICQAYHHHAWYWEIALILQKLLLTGVVIFFKPGTTIQLALAFLIAFFFLLTHAAVDPFVDRAEGNLQQYANIAIVLTLFGGILLKTKSEGGSMEKLVLAAILVLCNVCVVGLFLAQAIAPPNPALFKQIAEHKARKLICQIRDRGEASSCEEEERLLRRLLMWFQANIHEFLWRTDTADDGKTYFQLDDEAVVAFTERIIAASVTVSNHEKAALKPLTSLMRSMMVEAAFTDLFGSLEEATMESLFKDIGLDGSDQVVHVESNPFRTTEFEIEVRGINGEETDAKVAARDEGGGVGLPSALPPAVEPPTAIRKIFDRFDFDDSGTLNSFEELQQMTLNTIFTMGYAISPEEVDERIRDMLDVVEEEPLDFDEFWAYFLSVFGPPKAVGLHLR